MNKTGKKNYRKILVAAGALMVAVIIAGAAAFAEEDLLTPGGSQVEAGQGLSFSVNLSEVKEEYEAASEAFTVTVNISPAPESVSISPDVNVTQYGSKYTISSADLNGITGVTFTVYPGSGLTAKTTYTVSASVAGNLSTPSDSFTFTAVPAEKKEDPKKEDQKGMKGKTGGAAAMSGSVSAGTSADTSTTYYGSADNYLKKLSVEGYKFTEKFNSTRDTYFLHVPEDVESLDVSATADDDDATVRIAGADSISEEMSKIMINVTAENGDVRVYRIYVTHKTEDE